MQNLTCHDRIAVIILGWCFGSLLIAWGLFSEAAQAADRPKSVAVSAPDPAWTTRAKVVRVIDGDTVEVEVRRVIRVRMLDCWAPESRQDPRILESRRLAEKKKGQASKENLIRLADGKQVTLSIPMSEDGEISDVLTLGRVLGHVWLIDSPAESLSKTQVRMGHATTTKPEELK